MAGEIEVKINGRGYASPSKAYTALAARIDKNWKNAVGQVERELRIFMDSVIAELRKRHGTPWPAGTSNNSLSVRSGDLINELSDSERIISSQTLSGLRGIFGLSETMVFHEYGGTKTAGGKMMTIPLPAALDSKGRPLKQSARDWDNTFVAQSRAGNLIIFQRRAGRIVPLYVLKDTVTVPARLGFREELNNGIPRFVSRMADQVAASLSK